VTVHPSRRRISCDGLGEGGTTKGLGAAGLGGEGTREF
jgi:hypothetical protein